MRLFCEEQQKYIQSSQNNVTYHPMNPVTYQAVNLFSSDRCFIYFISNVPHYIWWNQRNTVYTILVKVDILDTCGAIICSYFGITFLLFFLMLENVVHTSCQNSMLFCSLMDIINIQNNQFLEFKWKPMLAPLRSVIDQRFSRLRNVFLKSFQDWLNSAQQRQGNFTKDAD